MERGYNCLAFEGPGQGGVIREQKIPFRFDWERVVTPVIDFLLENKEEYCFKKESIALMGISLGGYLAHGQQHLNIVFQLVFYIMVFMMEKKRLNQVFLHHY